MICHRNFWARGLLEISCHADRCSVIPFVFPLFSFKIIIEKRLTNGFWGEMVVEVCFSLRLNEFYNSLDEEGLCQFKAFIVEFIDVDSKEFIQSAFFSKNILL